MKKIVFVINADWYFKLHWLERAVFLKKNGYKVHVLANFETGEIFDELSDLGFECRSISIARSSINIYYDLKYLLKLYFALKEIEPDLIHAVTIKPNIYSGLINRLFINKPIVYSVTGLGIVFSSGKLKFKALRRIVVLLYKVISTSRSRFIFENGDDLKKFGELAILKGNGLVIEGAGVDIEKFSPKPLPKSRSILFAARLLKDKGLDTLISAVKLLRERDIEFTLNVAGLIDDDANGSISIRELEALHEDSLINWLGSRSDMASLISDNDIVCLPTRYGEGVPRILIEGAACGRALVATDVSGCRDIVQDNKNGFLVPTDNVELLADRLSILLTDSALCASFGSAGRDLVEKVYSNEIVFDKTISVYRKF